MGIQPSEWEWPRPILACLGLSHCCTSNSILLSICTLGGSSDSSHSGLPATHVGDLD